MEVVLLDRAAVAEGNLRGLVVYPFANAQRGTKGQKGLEVFHAAVKVGLNCQAQVRVLCLEPAEDSNRGIGS